MIEDRERHDRGLTEQEIPQGAEVSQNALACLGMTFELREFVDNESKCLLLPGIACFFRCEQRFDFRLGFLDLDVKEMHEFLCALNGLERRRVHFCSMQHSVFARTRIVCVLDQNG